MTTKWRRTTRSARPPPPPEACFPTRKRSALARATLNQLTCSGAPLGTQQLMRSCLDSLRFQVSGGLSRDGATSVGRARQTSSGTQASAGTHLGERKLHEGHDNSAFPEDVQTGCTTQKQYENARNLKTVRHRKNCPP